MTAVLHLAAAVVFTGCAFVAIANGLETWVYAGIFLATINLGCAAIR